MAMRYGHQSIGRQAPAMKSAIPPKATTSEKDFLPSLCQVIAMAMCYRRLGFIFSVPTALILAPILLNALFGALNSMTQNLGLPLLVSVAIATRVWRRQRDAFALSLGKQLEEAERKDQVILPLAFFLVFCLPLWRFEIPEETWGINALRWTPTVAWDIGIRPAIGLALINAATLFRFVGRGSVVRCSTVPLASNDYINSMRSWYGFMVNLAISRSSNAGALPVDPPSLFRMGKSGRRYQCPTLISFAANMVVTCLVGYIVAEYILLPFYQGFGGVKRCRQFIDFTCLLTMCLHLWIPDFNGTGHELNPKHYSSNHASGGKIHPVPVSATALKQIAKRVLLMTLAIFVLGIVGVGVYNRSLAVSTMDKDAWPLVLHCIAISVLLGGYAAIIEEFAKSTLFVDSSLQRFVREVTMNSGGNRAGGGSRITMQEEEDFVVDAALHSVLHGDTAFVQQIGESTASKPSGHPQLQTFEAIEAIRNNQAINVMANVMLGRLDSKRPVEVCLEEDVLRISFLQSLGGSNQPTNNENATGDSAIVVWKEHDPYPIDARHFSAIEYWVKPSASIGQVVLPTQDGHLRKEPKSVLLTRALCAFTGGLGQALSECSRSNATTTTWLLRPGALCAAEYCVIALSRVLLVYFEHCKKTGSDCRRTQLSSLIPATLNSMYRLHDGILQYAHYLEHLRGLAPGTIPPRSVQSANGLFSDVNERISKDHPDLFVVLRAIEEGGAKTILRQLGQRYNMMSMKNALDTNCDAWIKKIKDSLQHS